MHISGQAIFANLHTKLRTKQICENTQFPKPETILIISPLPEQSEDIFANPAKDGRPNGIHEHSSRTTTEAQVIKEFIVNALSKKHIFANLQQDTRRFNLPNPCPGF